MTRLVLALLALDAAAVGWLTYAAAVCLQHQAHGEATAFSTTAILFVVAIGREWQRAADTALARAEAVRTGHPRPGRPAHGDVDAIVRAELAAGCRCDRWWTALGAEHDTWCPNHPWSSNS